MNLTFNVTAHKIFKTFLQGQAAVMHTYPEGNGTMEIEDTNQHSGKHSSLLNVPSSPSTLLERYWSLS